LRVVSGKLGGRRLFVSSKAKLRPTADRVKESIFDILRSEIEGKEVLDLFAGSGNLGIEAISRGANRVVFVDSSNQSIKHIQRNLKDLECEDQAKILKSDYRKAVGELAKTGERFDMVFADPPYLLGYAQGLIDCLKKEDILKEGGLAIIEHHKKEELKLNSSGLMELERRKFGDTMVTVLFKKGK